MLGLLYSRFGEPPDVLAPAEVPIPEPGPGQTLIQVLCSPIHNHDLATIRGIYGVKPKLPAVGGSELVGVVGGKRVACITQGAWAQYTLAPEALLAPIPDGIPDEVACQLLAMPLSAIVLLDELRVNGGDWIVQNAANGAVGKILMREAQRRGVNVINLVRRESGADELRKAGAQRVVVTENDWVDRVLEEAGGAPIVRAIDSVGGPDSANMQRLLAQSGELIVFGGLSGSAMRLDPGRLISHELIVRGFWMTAWMRRPQNADRLASSLRRVFELASGGGASASGRGHIPARGSARRRQGS